MPRLAALGPAVFAGAAVCAAACTTEVRAPCGGLCGEGTECVADRCQPIAVAEPEPRKAPGTRGRKGKRTRTTDTAGAGGDDAAGPVDEAAAPDEAPPPFHPVDDSKIPQFKQLDEQTLDLKAGSERLSESELDRHFAQVTPAIQRCVTTASAYEEIGSGSLRFKLRVLPSGKVEGVTLTAPASLRVWGIPPCARKAVYEHRFPAFDGPAMVVSFGVDIQ